MGALRTSDHGDVVAGEGRKDPTSADDRPVDAGAKIIISAGPIAAAPPSATSTASTVAPSRPRGHSAQLPTAEPRRSGLALVIALYVLSAAALAYAIYERFVV